MSLTDKQVDALKPREKRYTVTDGRGLAIEVYPTGGKGWRYRFSLNGKPDTVTLGKYPAMSLKAARLKRDELAALVAAGKSPTEQKRKVKEARAEATTLQEFGERYYSEVIAKDRKDPKGLRRYLDKDIFPALGSKPMRDIVTEDVRKVIWHKKDHGFDAAAAEIRGLLKRLFDYAQTYGLVTVNPVLALPMRHVFKPRPRQRTLSPQEIRTFLRAVYHSSIRRQFKLALHLLLLTMSRKSELLLARWEHVDFEEGTWSIPEELTKTGKPHIVYLSSQAKELFGELKQLAGGSELVLPGRGSLKQPFAHNAINKAKQQAVADLDVPHFTIHDLRRTASTLLHENGWSSDVVEKAMNHTIGGVRGVYNRAQYAEQRRDMLQFWANYVGSLIEEGKVILGNFRAVGEE